MTCKSMTWKSEGIRYPFYQSTPFSKSKQSMAALTNKMYYTKEELSVLSSKLDNSLNSTKIVKKAFRVQYKLSCIGLRLPYEERVMSKLWYSELPWLCKKPKTCLVQHHPNRALFEFFDSVFREPDSYRFEQVYDRADSPKDKKQTYSFIYSCTRTDDTADVQYVKMRFTYNKGVKPTKPDDWFFTMYHYTPFNGGWALARMKLCVDLIPPECFQHILKELNSVLFVPSSIWREKEPLKLSQFLK